MFHSHVTHAKSCLTPWVSRVLQAIMLMVNRYCNTVPFQGKSFDISVNVMKRQGFYVSGTLTRTLVSENDRSSKFNNTSPNVVYY